MSTTKTVVDSGNIIVDETGNRMDLDSSVRKRQ